MDKVYVIQIPHRLDHTRGARARPVISVKDAERFGEIITLLKPTARPWDHSVTAELRRKLATFSVSDYLLPAGNPALIGMASAIAANSTGGIVNFLVWDKNERRYDVVPTKLF